MATENPNQAPLTEASAAVSQALTAVLHVILTAAPVPPSMVDAELQHISTQLQSAESPIPEPARALVGDALATLIRAAALAPHELAALLEHVDTYVTTGQVPKAGGGS